VAPGVRWQREMTLQVAWNGMARGVRWHGTWRENGMHEMAWHVA